MNNLAINPARQPQGQDLKWHDRLKKHHAALGLSEVLWMLNCCLKVWKQKTVIHLIGTRDF